MVLLSSALVLHTKKREKRTECPADSLQADEDWQLNCHSEESNVRKERCGEEEEGNDTGRVQQSLSRRAAMTSEEQQEASHHAGTRCSLPVR